MIEILNGWELSYLVESLHSSLNVQILRQKRGSVRKNATHKKRSQEKSHVLRAKFSGRAKLPGWPGERWYSTDSGPGMAF
jgi:hypothetical protein